MRNVELNVLRVVHSDIDWCLIMHIKSSWTRFAKHREV